MLKSNGKWYPKPAVEDPLLALAGSGKNLWPSDAVTYVRELREDSALGSPNPCEPVSRDADSSLQG